MLSYHSSIENFEKQWKCPIVDVQSVEKAVNQESNPQTVGVQDSSACQQDVNKEVRFEE